MVSDAFIAEVDNELGVNWSNTDKRFVCDAVLRAALSHLAANADRTLSANPDRTPSEDKKVKQLIDAAIGAMILVKAPLHE
jgi:hypothetical protein